MLMKLRKLVLDLTVVVDGFVSPIIVCEGGFGGADEAEEACS